MSLGAFFLDVVLPVGIGLGLLCLLHCALTRRGVAWGLVIIFLGPLGGLFYLANLLGWIRIGPPMRPLSPTPTASRRCPRCQQPAPILYDLEDGRVTLRLCAMCKSEMEFRRSDFKLSDL